MPQGCLLDKIIDDADRRILRELQLDSSRTVTEIADAVGLSHAPCWRRIQRLRAAGYILRESAIVDRSKLGWELEFFIYLKFSTQARGNVPEFRRKIIQHERVIGAYIVLGNFDLMLHVVARTMRDYQAFYLEHLSGQSDLGDINTMTVMSTLKEAQVPV
jgi:Lrp/AsnC family transcriptional regulator, cysteine-sensing transcriptional activator